MSEFILNAFGFDGEGGGTPLTGKQIGEHLEADKLAWVHMDADSPETRKWLEAEIAYLDPFVTGALLAVETRPRITQIGDGAIIVLRGVNLNDAEDEEDMVSIRLWIDAHRIVSVQKRPVRAVSALSKKLESGTGPKDAGQFICMLLSQLFSRFEPVLTTLDERTDDTEEALLSSANATLRRDITDIRRKAIIFRRHMAPQKDVVSQLRLADFSWIRDRDIRHLQENYNYVLRYVEELDAIRERAQIVKDELANTIADRLNKNMYILSMISAIFLPLGFLTGLLGINVGGIPGAENASAFLMFCGMLALIIFLQITIFKKLKWF
jgi:zinc transporter